MVWLNSPLTLPIRVAMDNVAFYTFLCPELCYYKYVHLFHPVLAMHAPSVHTQVAHDNCTWLYVYLFLFIA